MYCVLKGSARRLRVCIRLTSLILFRCGRFSRFCAVPRRDACWTDRARLQLPLLSFFTPRHFLGAADNQRPVAYFASQFRQTAVLKTALAFWGISLLAVLANSVTAHAQIASPSPGCNTANAGGLDDGFGSGAPATVTIAPFGGTFAQGEVLTFVLTTNVNETAGTIDLDHDQTGAPAFDGTSPTNGTFTIPASGNNTFSGAINFPAAEGGVTFTVRCAPATIAPAAVGPRQTLDRIKTFLHRRADLLLEEEPDRNRLLRRLAVSDDGRGNETGFAAGLATPFSLLASDEGNARKLTFSTSLNQLRRTASANMVHALDLAPGGSFKPAAAPREWIDIWVEGHYTHFEDNIGQGDRDGHLGVLYLGADNVIRPWLLIGALVQYEWAEDEATRFGSDVQGTGWMAGPYLTARLHENLFFDVRGAWGETENDINIIGVNRASFDTERWLAIARLTGDWWRGNFRVTPSASVKYVEEDQQSFTNSLGVVIPNQTVTLGRLAVGSEFGYRYQAADGTRVEPHISIDGLWDFDDAGSLSLGGVATTANANDMRAKVEGGVMLTRPGGVGLRATAAYDGIGDGDFSAYSGKVWVNLPLN